MADEATARKHTKYRTLARFQQATLQAFAMETYGGVGKEAKNTVNTIAGMAVDNGSLQSKQYIASELLDEVAINVQRGNARMMRAGELQRKMRSRF